MSAVTSPKDSFSLVYTENALHLKDTILWLDAESGGQLSFFSAARETLSSLKAQIIATEETVKLMEVFRPQPNALVCQYNRPFSIGKLKMELLPSGYVLGGASLYVEEGRRSLLYAPLAHHLSAPIHRRQQLRKAETLVLFCGALGNSLGAKQRKKDKDLLFAKLKDWISRDLWPVIYCKGFPIAQELTHDLSQQGIPLAVHQQIFQINKLYEQYGSPLGSFAVYNNKRARKRVVLAPFSALSRKRFAGGQERPRIFVNEGDGTGLPKGLEAGEGALFSLPSMQDFGAYLETVEQVKPKQVYFYGPSAEQHAALLQKHTELRATALLANNQPSLFAKAAL